MKTEYEAKLRRAKKYWRLCWAAHEVLGKRGLWCIPADVLKVARMSRRDFYEMFRSFDDLIVRMLKGNYSDYTHLPNISQVSQALPVSAAEAIGEEAPSHRLRASEDAEASDEEILAWHEACGDYDARICRMLGPTSKRARKVAV